jgi:hypothetical protein
MRSANWRFDRVVPLLLLLLIFGWSSAASAVDGVIEINQAKALVGGVTATDTAGYPVTIDASGSYRLTGDLVVPDENTTAIRVESTADDVAIDLNGFSILGPELSGSGSGILGLGGGRLQISNGSIAGVGSSAIFISSGTVALVDAVVLRNIGGHGMSCTSSSCSLSRSIIRQVAFNGMDCSFGSCQVIDNHISFSGLRGIVIPGGSVSGNIVLVSGSDGIRVNSAVVTENTVNDFNGNGIISLEASVVTNNVVIDGTGDGIEINSSSLLTGNMVRNNTGVGLRLGAATGYSQNVVDSNTAGTVVGGVQMGTNICDGNTTCP